MFTPTQLEQVIPPEVASVERMPSTPDLATVAVLVTVIAGSVSASDCDHSDVTVPCDTSHPLHVTAPGVATVRGHRRNP